MKSKLILIARWIAVLPTFVIAYVISYLIMYGCYRFWADEDSWAMKYFLPVFGSLISGIFSIIYAAKIAPNYKKNVAFTLMVIMLMISGVLIFFSIIRQNYVGMLAIIASAIGNIAGNEMCRDEKSIEEI